MIPDWLPISTLPELKLYQNFHKITEGGFAEIYSAERRQKGKINPVLVKRLKPLLVQDADHRSLFENECRVLKQLDCPNIPRFYEGFISASECFFFMKLIQGRDVGHLAKIAKSSGKIFPIELILFIGTQVAQTLDYLHHFRSPSGEEISILHCDVKPHNLLFSPDSQVHLIDFSVATFLAGAKPHGGGTHAFMPPERLAGQELTVQADLAGLTLSLFLMAAGRPLIKAQKISELFGVWLSEKYHDTIREQGFPLPLEEFFRRNLAFNPQARAPEAALLKAEIIECASRLKLDVSSQNISSKYRSLAKIS